MLVGLWLLALAHPCAASETEERPGIGASLGWRHERGVETKGLAGVVAQARSGSLRTAGVVRVAFGEQAGLSALALQNVVRVYDPWRVSGTLTLQHEQWSAWEVGENRALAGMRLGPLRGVTLDVGAARRWPVFDPARYASPFVWKSSAPAWTLYYDLEVVLVKHARVETWVSFANVDRLTLNATDHIGVHLFSAPALRGPLKLIVHWATAVQGIVPIALSAKDLTFELGVLFQP